MRSYCRITLTLFALLTCVSIGRCQPGVELEVPLNLTSEGKDQGPDLSLIPRSGESIQELLPSGEDRFPTIKVSGFFQLDAGYFLQDDNSRLTLGDINDGLGFRRTRLAAKGNVAEDTSYIIEFDIAQAQARFVDVWFQQNDTRFGNIRIGRFRQPFGMAELTSVRELPFLERAVTFSEATFRQTGIMFFGTTENDQRTWAVSGYRFASDNFGNVFSDTGGYGIATRLTGIAAEWGTNRLWHCGFDYSFSSPKNGVIQIASTNEFASGQNPNAGPAGLSVLPFEGVPPFVNTGPIPAESTQVLNIESALALNRMAIQSEIRWDRVNKMAGGTAVFPSAYVHVRYMITGEEIPYKKSQGVFGRIVPLDPLVKRTGAGALEFAGRISHIDLNDAGITGRRLTNFTSGLNWYWNKSTKLQFNWIHSQLDDAVLRSSSSNTFAIRAQLDF